jgi:hypothetical protein
MIALLPIILFVTTGIYETVKIALLPIILFVTTDIYEKVKIQGVPELADQIETVYSLMVMKVKNV